MLPEREGDMNHTSIASLSIVRVSTSSRLQVQMQPRQEGLSERESPGPEKASNLSAAEVWLGSSTALQGDFGGT